MRTFVYTLAMYLLAFVAIDAVSSIVIYFIKYYLQWDTGVNLVNGALLIAQVFVLPVYVALSKRTNKKTGYIVGALIWIVTMLFSLLITPETPAFAVYAFSIAVGLGTGGIVVMVYAILPDIPDIDELQSGARREGIYAALFTFMRKLSSAFAIFLVSNAISLAGYVPPLEKVVDGATQLIEQPQSDTFVLVLRLVFVLVPVFFLAIALVFASRFPLTSQVHQRLNQVLTSRRNGEPDSEETRREAEALSQLLIGGQ
jgi:oligogalacturonide transporter